MKQTNKGVDFSACYQVHQMLRIGTSEGMIVKDEVFQSKSGFLMPPHPLTNFKWKYSKRNQKFYDHQIYYNKYLQNTGKQFNNVWIRLYWTY